MAITVSAVSCSTLMVNYTVNPLPGGGNEATLRSLEVSYRPILGSGSAGTRSVALNGNTMEGVLCLLNLTSNAAYRVTYSVEVNTDMSTGLPSDLSAPIELFTGRTCNSQQCLVVSSTRTVTISPSTCPTSISPSPTPTGKDECCQEKMMTIKIIYGHKYVQCTPCVAGILG